METILDCTILLEIDYTQSYVGNLDRSIFIRRSKLLTLYFELVLLC